MKGLEALLDMPSYVTSPHHPAANYLRDASSEPNYVRIKFDESNAAKPEPAPTANNHPAIADIVAADFVTSGEVAIASDIMERKAFGLAKYKTPLQPFNGRNNINDLYQELLDAVKYARVVLYETQYADKRDTDAQGVYDSLKELVGSVHYLKTEAERNASNTGTSGTAGSNRKAP